MDISMGVVFFAYFFGAWAWSWGCWVCFAVVATAPAGAFLCWIWARRQGLDAARCAKRGALYWACGLMPWVHFAFQINGLRPPRWRMRVAYFALCAALMLGPVIGGFFRSADLMRHEWLVVTPVLSLLALPTVLVALAMAEQLPAARQRVHTGHVVAATLGALAMLTWLPHRLFAW